MSASPFQLLIIGGAFLFTATGLPTVGILYVISVFVGGMNNATAGGFLFVLALAGIYLKARAMAKA
jgi:hypothetical protein